MDENNLYRITQLKKSHPTEDPPESWLDNYIALDTMADIPSIDIYEHYWAHQVTDKATVRDILDWLKMASTTGETLYELLLKPSEHLLSRYEDTNRRKMKIFNRRGYFRRNAYRHKIQWQVRITLILMGLLEESAVGNAPGLKMFLNHTRRKLERLLIQYLGDVVIYTNPDRKALHYEIRQKIIQGLKMHIDTILQDDRYTSMLLIGHSLGSVIAYDVLNEIHTTPGVREHHKKLQGFITLGSPLDMFAFFFREAKKEYYIRRQILENIYCFKARRLDLRERSIEVFSAVPHHLDHVYWINFWDQKDPIGGHLMFYDVDENIHFIMEKSRGGATHVAFWDHDPMYMKILETFFPRPDNHL